MINLESQDINNHKIEELEKVEELKHIFPEAFEDGKLNIEKFKNLLFDIKDEKSEHYSFNWSGKQDCYKIIKQKSNLTLKLDSSHSELDSESNSNVFIEGDNLEVLKLLQTSYHKKIKMIYIDPPYNKDKDFVYSDTWGDTITNYLIQTDQLRDEGYTSTKTSSTGRRHTNWLNMIYPRLWLSRNLLKDDGVIFVSIDDDEVANLRKVMDEIYGEENFVAQFIWKKRTGSNDAKNLVSADHEYVLCYSKYTETSLNGIKKEFENYKNHDDDIRGDWMPDNLTCNKTASERPNLFYPITDPETNITYECNPNRVWAYEKVRMQKNIDEKKIIFPKNKNGTPMYKRHKEEVKSDTKPMSTMLGDFLNASSTKALRELLEGQFFDYPKSVDLIKILVAQATNENDIILDFFAGSGTTAHAVMELNQEDEKEGKVGNRKYILVQLPEATDESSEAYKAGYKIISDITKERIKRVIKKLGLQDGFKSYRLDSSNFQVFKELKKRPNDSFEDIMKMLKMSVFTENILTQSAKYIDIVYEVALKNGFSLSAKNEEIKTPKYSFIRLHEETREFYFCFDKEVKRDIKDFVPKEAKLICFDKALDDSTKLNLRENLDLETL